MLKRLCFAAPVALLLLLTTTQTTAFAVLPIHPNPAYSQRNASYVSLADAIANRARVQAESMSSVGFCYRGVKRALNRVGVCLNGSAAYLAKSQLCKDPRFCMVPLKGLRKGDILVHGRSRAHPYGHIAVYLGDNLEASDHVQKLVLGGRYGATCVFRPHGKIEP
ncbi:MAG TPA: hypothetical protein V6D22_11310 [Candidatus Obscuribacterales bacterium]